MLYSVDFEITTSKHITAYNGSANRTKIKLKPLSAYLDVKLDNKEHFHWLDNGCDRVEVYCNGETVDATFNEGELFVPFGNFTHTTGSYNYLIIGYFNGDTSPFIMTDNGRVEFKTL